jgi:hypothetical protein
LFFQHLPEGSPIFRPGGDNRGAIRLDIHAGIRADEKSILVASRSRPSHYFFRIFRNFAMRAFAAGEPLGARVLYRLPVFLLVL